LKVISFQKHCADEFKRSLLLWLVTCQMKKLLLSVFFRESSNR